MRSRVPAALDLDTFDGRAWIGVVPFLMSGVRLRGTPAIPRLSRFPELNVRTYVTLDGRPGVYFFSLDASNVAAVRVARRWARLPYFHATMSCNTHEGIVSYFSVRIEPNTPEAEFVGSYRPNGPAYRAEPGTLDDWLTARFCFYTLDRRSRVWRGDVDHAPWQLQQAIAEIRVNTMTEAARIVLPDTAPLLHFAQRTQVITWSPQRVG
jgi:uncharacterized protein YqjF (DUF2071 family)